MTWARAKKTFHKQKYSPKAWHLPKMLCQPFFYAALLDVEYKPIINQKVVVTDWRSFFLSKKGKVIAELNEFGKGRKSVQVKFENGDVSKFNFFQLTAE